MSAAGELSGGLVIMREAPEPDSLAMRVYELGESGFRQTHPAHNAAGYNEPSLIKGTHNKRRSGSRTIQVVVHQFEIGQKF